MGDLGRRGQVVVGKPGLPGPPGKSVVNRGAWAQPVLYNQGDLVTYNGRIYIALLTHTSSSGLTPANATYWLLSGSGFVWRGAYNGSTAYLTNDAVSYNGTSYIALGATTGNLPTNLSFWNVIVAGVVPPAGTTGQVLAKNSGTDYDLKWLSIAAVALSGAYTDLTGLPTLGTISSHAAGDYAAVANNLSDLSSAPTARTNLGLGTGALLVTDVDGTLAANSDANVATQKAVKTYIDNAVNGISWKNSVACATTASITLSGEQTIDGIATSASRVLVKNQSSATQNGIYVSGSGAWTRSADANTGPEISNATTLIIGGTQAGEAWNCPTQSITIGTTAIAWVQVSAAGVTYTANSGITLSGTAFSLSTIADGSMLANTSGLTAAPSATTVSALLDHAIGSTSNQVLVRGAAFWAQGAIVDATVDAAAAIAWSKISKSGATASDVGALGATAAAGGVLSGNYPNPGFANQTSNTILANVSGGSGAAAATTITALLDAVAGNAQGSLVTRNGTTWVALGPGSSGQVLQAAGASANLSWVDTTTVLLGGSALWGSGSDGNLTVSATNTTSGPITSGSLTRDAYFNNLTMAAGGGFKTAGFRVFVAGILDVTAGIAAAITASGPAGGNASAATGGTAGTGITSNTVGGSGSGTVGPNGSNGSSTAASSPTNQTPANGGASGTNGAGGGGTTTGGTLGSTTAGATVSNAFSIERWVPDLLRLGTMLVGGAGGPGGGGGVGAGPSAGGGGGGGGAGGGVLAIYAKTISRGGSTPAGVFSAKGGAGGTGGLPPTPTGTSAGGGGGGSAGGGGWATVISQNLTGSSASNAIDVSGGTGGTGGNGVNQGAGTVATGGNGGAGGAGGRIALGVLSTSTWTISFGSAGTGGTAHTTTTGGPGGAGNTVQATL